MQRLAAALVVAAALPGGGHAEEEADLIGDAERGARLFQPCSACHQIGPDAENRIGPHLNDVFGRPAGALDFRYSAALDRAAEGGLVWTLDSLDAFIETPDAVVRGTRMSYRGMADPQNRRDLLAFLRENAPSPQDIPESEPTAIAREVALPPGTLDIVGDVAYGEYLASECVTCHKRDGGDEGIPSITYWPEADFVLAMHAYKQETRDHEVMRMMAGRLSDEEIAALAAYFAQID